MKKFLSFPNKRLLFLIFSFLIILILIILGFSFPKGRYGIKPFKTVTYIATQQQYFFNEDKGTKNHTVLFIFLILLAIATVIYLITHPSQILIYTAVIIFLFFVFYIVPQMIKSFNIMDKNLANKHYFEDKPKKEIEEEDDDSEKYFPTDELHKLPVNNQRNSYYTFIVILLFVASLFLLYIVIIFLLKIISRIIQEIKEGTFYLFTGKNKDKKVLVSEISDAINEAIYLIDSKNDIKATIINCYLALLYSVKKYANKPKDPSYTCREFEPTLLSLGLEYNDVEIITNNFEKAKYSKLPLTFSDKETILKSLKNCILKLKKIKNKK